MPRGCAPSCAPLRPHGSGDQYDLRILPVEFNEHTNQVTALVEIPHRHTTDLWDTLNQWAKCIVVSGEHKSGVTSIVAGITRKKLPIGERTRGISAVHMKEKSILVFDAPGADDVQTENLSNMEADMRTERREHFTSEMLTDISVNHIHVMRRQTRPAMRNLWGRMKRTQHGQKHDLTVVYNLYPHPHDMAHVEQKIRETVESYGEFVDLKDTWNFSTRQDGVCVHHWFWLDDKWPEGRAVNESQINNMWVHFRTLNTHSAESVRKDETTQDVVKRAFERGTPKFAQPQGHGCQVVCEPITTLTHSGGYKPIAQITSTLVNAQMATMNLVKKHGRIVRGANGFNPTPRFAFDKDQLVILVLIEAENCRLVEGNLSLEEGDARHHEGLVSVRKDVPYPGCPHWKCTHIAIKKVPHLDLGKYKAEDNVEQDGRFDLYYPRLGESTPVPGTLTLLKYELQNGLLIVRLKVTPTMDLAKSSFVQLKVAPTEALPDGSLAPTIDLSKSASALQAPLAPPAMPSPSTDEPDSVKSGSSSSGDEENPDANQVFQPPSLLQRETSSRPLTEEEIAFKLKKAQHRRDSAGEPAA